MERRAMKRSSTSKGGKRRIGKVAVASPATVLASLFRRSGYVRALSDERKAAEGNGYKKGFEVRLSLQTTGELAEAQAALEALGMRPGKPFHKHSRIVQPVYGKNAVEWFIGRVGR
jgi:hypothetical protein